MLVGIGENAGVVDVGDGLAVTFKVESHNHPSYVEPYQGAATGVGGIVRDILTMGARPIAVMDSLRFGDAIAPDTQRLVAGHRGRRRRLRQLPRPAQHRRRGRLRPDVRRQPARQRAVRRRAAARPDPARPGQGRRQRWSCCSARRPAATASAASRCWPARRSTVPRRRSRRGAVEAAERAGRRPVHREGSDRVLPRALRPRPGRRHPGPRWRGPVLRHERDGGSRRRRHARRLETVPLREASMSPLEVLTSESQERMLAIVEPRQRRRRARALRPSWGVLATVIGEVTDGDRLVISWHGEVVVDVPPGSLADDGPVYTPAGRPPRRRAGRADRRPTRRARCRGRRPRRSCGRRCCGWWPRPSCARAAG